MLQAAAAVAATLATIPYTRPTSSSACPGIGGGGIAYSEDFVVAADAHSTLSVARVRDQSMTCALNRLYLEGQHFSENAIAYILNSDGVFTRIYRINATQYLQMFRLEFNESSTAVSLEKCGAAVPLPAFADYSISHGHADKTATVVLSQGNAGPRVMKLSYSSSTCSADVGSALPGNLLYGRQLSALSPDARVLAMTSPGAGAREFVIQKLRADGTADGAAYALERVFRTTAFALRGDHSMVVINDKNLEVYDVLTRPEKVVKGPFAKFMEPFVLSPDGAGIISETTYSWHLSERVCSVESGEQCHDFDAGDHDSIQSRVYAPDGASFALVTTTGQIYRFELTCEQGFVADGANKCRTCTDADLPAPCGGRFTSDGKTCSCTECSIQSDCSSPGTLYVKPSADRLQCVCTCTNKFEGKKCDSCPSNFGGQLCNECSYQRYPGYPNCSLTCTKENQGCGRGAYGVDSNCKCQCGVDWTGDKCTECDDHRAGENCTECESGYSPVDGVSGGPDPAFMVVTCSQDLELLLTPLWIVCGVGAAVSAVVFIAIVVYNRNRRMRAAARGPVQPYYAVAQRPVMGIPQGGPPPAGIPVGHAIPISPGAAQAYAAQPLVQDEHPSPTKQDPGVPV